MSDGFFFRHWFGVPAIPVKDMYLSGISCVLLEDEESSSIVSIIGYERYNKYAKVTSRDWSALLRLNKSTGINVYIEVINMIYENFYK
ncbi:MAG: hypothetical protein GY775_19385 [Candidatus Scalindua sp.]|nr:hypothetical protein [Candidatus Scalindua sp.]